MSARPSFTDRRQADQRARLAYAYLLRFIPLRDRPFAARDFTAWANARMPSRRRGDAAALTEALAEAVRRGLLRIHEGCYQ